MKKYVVSTILHGYKITLSEDVDADISPEDTPTTWSYLSLNIYANN